MLKRILYATIVLAVLAFFAAWELSSFPPTAQTCDKNPYTAQEECATHSIPVVAVILVGRFIEYHAGAITALATLAIGWFTYILYGATTEQARLTRDSIKLARDEFNATHRPRIVVQRISDYWDGRDDKAAFMKIAIVNAGDSPAYVTEFLGTLYVQDAGSAFVPRLIPERSTKYASRRLAVGQWDTLKIEIDDISMFDIGFAQQAKEQPFERSMRFYGIGSVTYRGDDGAIRQTGFCREYHHGTGMWRPVKDSEYEYTY